MRFEDRSDVTSEDKLIRKCEHEGVANDLNGVQEQTHDNENRDALEARQRWGRLPIRSQGHRKGDSDPERDSTVWSARTRKRVRERREQRGSRHDRDEAVKPTGRPSKRVGAQTAARGWCRRDSQKPARYRRVADGERNRPSPGPPARPFKVPAVDVAVDTAKAS